MTYEVKGYVTFDIEDFAGDVEVHTDVRTVRLTGIISYEYSTCTQYLYCTCTV